jgi:hypothetical protein
LRKNITYTGSRNRINLCWYSKILNGETNNPNNSTIDLIMKFQQHAVELKLEESTTSYEAEPKTDILKYYDCLENENKSNSPKRLNSILRKTMIF